MFKRKVFTRPTVIAGILVAGIGLMSGCAAPPPEPGTPAAEALAKKMQQEAELQATQQAIAGIPEWCRKPPMDAKSVTDCGTGRSSDLQIAMDKALISAKAKLASRINGVIQGRVRAMKEQVGADDDEVIGTFESAVQTLIKPTKLVGYSQADSEILAEGKLYRAYVLLRYPRRAADRLLYDEVKRKQNKKVEVRLRSSKIFQDIEKDIEEARKRSN